MLKRLPEQSQRSFSWSSHNEQNVEHKSHQSVDSSRIVLWYNEKEWGSSILRIKRSGSLHLDESCSKTSYQWFPIPQQGLLKETTYQQTLWRCKKVWRISSHIFFSASKRRKTQAHYRNRCYFEIWCAWIIGRIKLDINISHSIKIIRRINLVD